MQANPEKFQAILLGKRGHDGCEDFPVRGITIKCEDSVKLYFDYLLNFNLHVSNICEKQTQIFEQLSKYWDLVANLQVFHKVEFHLLFTGLVFLL